MVASLRSDRSSRRKRRPASPRGRKITCPTSTRSVNVLLTSTPSRNVMRVSSLGTRSSRSRHGGVSPERPLLAAEAKARQPSWQEDHVPHEHEVSECLTHIHSESERHARLRARHPILPLPSWRHLSGASAPRGGSEGPPALVARRSRRP